MLYAKNVFDTTAITGAFLNSDDMALTTNVVDNGRSGSRPPRRLEQAPDFG